MAATTSPQTSDSLLRRLAGASVTKAGLAKDQSAINAVIAETSKGSKFFENEKRKDEAVTERVEKIQKTLKELLTTANVARIEQQVDKLIAQLEAGRDLSHSIVHFDMDSFFAAVECLRDPTLVGKPFVVGGSVVSTASYAARAFGVRSGMATHVAQKLCPHLICLSSNFEAYSAVSKKVAAIMKQYDADMCMAGCDEGYVDITAYCENNAITAEDCVTAIRQEVFQATQLTVSAGIAPNMMLAKICSDKNKPNGQFALQSEPAKIRDKSLPTWYAFQPLLIPNQVPGVGRVQERLLDSIGIKTCGDIFTHRSTVQLLNKYFSIDYLLHAYLGLGSTIVQPGVREERKSVGVERTFDPISDEAVLIAKLKEIARTLEEDLQHGGWTGKTVTLKYKLDTFQSFTRARSLSRFISNQHDLFNIGKELLQAEFPLRIRLLGLRLTNLKDLKIAETAGIKRFLVSGPPSPNKKRKTSHQDTILEPDAGLNIGIEDSDVDFAHSTRPRAVSLEPSSSQPDLAFRFLLLFLDQTHSPKLIAGRPFNLNSVPQRNMNVLSVVSALTPTTKDSMRTSTTV
ncbi:IMS-domain-containing protein [Auriculariales sp. MPI-PUGE-AT-0066]|nr:IMS-domain-containing protein [Auriculariales sp. MPI-PUGE-AT-0066]